MSRFLLASIFFIATLVVCTAAQFDSVCTGENEQFYGCGACDSKCGVRMSCISVCRNGSCGCKFGYVRDSQNKCIPEKDCPPNSY